MRAMMSKSRFFIVTLYFDTYLCLFCGMYLICYMYALDFYLYI